MHNFITKISKRPNPPKPINKQGKRKSNKMDIFERIQVNPKIESNTTAKLVNPAENWIGRAAKVILENTNKELRSRLQLQQMIDATEVINRFKKIENKNKGKSMIFNIKKTFIPQKINNY